MIPLRSIGSGRTSDENVVESLKVLLDIRGRARHAAASAKREIEQFILLQVPVPAELVRQFTHFEREARDVDAELHALAATAAQAYDARPSIANEVWQPRSRNAKG